MFMEDTNENIWWLYAGDIGDIRIERQVHSTSSTRPAPLVAASPMPSRCFCMCDVSPYRDFSVVRFLNAVNSVGVRMALSIVGIPETEFSGFVSGFLST